MSAVGTTVRVVHEQRCQAIGPICGKRDEPPQRHDQRFWIGELRLALAYGVTERVGVEAQLPMRANRATVEYQRLDGTAFTPDYVTIHHRDETLWGLSDPSLGLRGAAAAGRVALTARAGVFVPLGRTGPDPFARGDAGLEHQHVQFGTGTFDPRLGLAAVAPLGPIRLRAQAQARLVLYENDYGYRAGPRYGGGLSTEISVAGFGASLGVDALREQSERWGGRVHEEGNLGRTDVLAGASLSHAVGATTVSLGVAVPVVTRLAAATEKGSRLEFPAVVTLSVGGRSSRNGI